MRLQPLQLRDVLEGCGGRNRWLFYIGYEKGAVHESGPHAGPTARRGSQARHGGLAAAVREVAGASAPSTKTILEPARFAYKVLDCYLSRQARQVAPCRKPLRGSLAIPSPRAGTWHIFELRLLQASHTGLGVALSRKAGCEGFNFATCLKPDHSLNLCL